MKYLRFSLLLVVLMAALGCKQEDLPEGTPRCVRREIEKIKADEVRSPPAKVYQMAYGEEAYYYFPPFCCDEMGLILDDRCNLLCKPDGGYTGLGDGTCPSFVIDSALFSDMVLIWEDER
jgi:hypothetical protein